MAKVDLSGLDLEGLNSLIEEATKLRDKKVDEKRAELMKQLEALDAFSRPSKASTTRQRSQSSYTHVHPKSGHEWLGRGGVPEAWQDIVSKDDASEVRRDKLKPYRVDR